MKPRLTRAALTGEHRLRTNRRLRDLARRLPVTSAYETRIAELTEEVHRVGADLREQNRALAARLEADRTADAVELQRELEELRGRLGCYPPGHYYSAIPSAEDVERDIAWQKRSPADIAGVDLRLDEQWAYLGALEPHSHGAPPTRYRAPNDFFGTCDAAVLAAILRKERPARLVEVGSGFSSACALDTITADLGGATDLTLIEPYPERMLELLLPGDLDRIRFEHAPVQDVPLDVFRALRAGDVLFIDSSHVSKAGSDVNWLVFEVLPRLPAGVFVHVHDVPAGFVCPTPWLREGRFWTEAYLVRAFLQFSEAFEILVWPNLLLTLDVDRFRRTLPAASAADGTSIWLRKVR
jgi:hypothetical protein